MIGKSSLESVMDSTTLITVIVEPEMFLKTIFHISQRIVCTAYVVITFIARTQNIDEKELFTTGVNIPSPSILIPMFILFFKVPNSVY